MREGRLDFGRLLASWVGPLDGLAGLPKIRELERFQNRWHRVSHPLTQLTSVKLEQVSQYCSFRAIILAFEEFKKNFKI